MSGYSCRYQCKGEVNGFVSIEERDQHEASYHIRVYRCGDISCDLSVRGFNTKAALKSHTRLYHSKATDEPVPILRRKKAMQLKRAALEMEDFEAPSNAPKKIATEMEGFEAPINAPKKIATEMEGFEAPINAPKKIATEMEDFEAIGNTLADLDLERLPEHLKHVERDWFAIFNPNVPRVLDVDLIHTLEHQSFVCCVRFSYDGKYIATGSNNVAQIFDVVTGQKIVILKDESVDTVDKMYIKNVCFSPNGKYLATGANKNLVRVWDIASRCIRNTLAGHKADICCLDFARDGRTIVSGSYDNTVRLWDSETGQNILTLSADSVVTAVAFSPDTKYIAAGTLDTILRVWDAVTGHLVAYLEGPDGHKGLVYSVAFAPNSKDLVSGSSDKTIKMWELATPRGVHVNNALQGGHCIKTFEGHKDFVLCTTFTPDGNWVLSGSRDLGVQFWDLKTGNVQLRLQGQKNSVIRVAASPSGGCFATGGDKCAKIWSYKSYP